MTKTCVVDIATLKAIALCASTEETRYYLAGVYVDIQPDHITYVATDGRRLAARRLNTDGEATEDYITGQFIIPSAVIKQLKVGKRETVSMATLQTEDEKTFDLNGILFKMVDGSFPDWRRVIPLEPLKAESIDMQFNPVFLADFNKIGEMLGVGKARCVPNGAGPALMDWGNGEDTLIGVCMPIRFAAPREKILPSWFAMHKASAVSETV